LLKTKRKPIASLTVHTTSGKIEYNCRYFIMSFRKQIGEYKFGKNCFHTPQSTMSHRLTNASSLKITAAYWAREKCLARKNTCASAS
jgi:hypothetical protein